MATNSLIIKDGSGATKSLAVSSGSYGFIPEHVISGTVSVAVTGAVNVTSSITNPVGVYGFVTSSVAIYSSSISLPVTSSTANPLAITGTVSVLQPVSVDLVVGDNLFVTSSITAPLYVSSSANSPVLVTGSVTVTSTGTSVVTASTTSPLAVTGTVGLSGVDYLIVTSSFLNPIAVTGTVFAVNNSVVTVTSSATNPILVTTPPAQNSSKTSISTKSGGSVDYTNETSGTFPIALQDSSRKGLIVFNPSQSELYISVGSGSKNGFDLDTTSSVPFGYSFILYTSGTYIADQTTLNAFHAGFFISSSAVSKAYITQIS